MRAIEKPMQGCRLSVVYAIKQSMEKYIYSVHTSCLRVFFNPHKCIILVLYHLMLPVSEFIVRGDIQKKRDFLGIFPKWGAVFAIPKTILYLPFHFLFAETWKFWGGPVFPKVKTGSFLGGHLFPKLLKSKIDQKVNIFVKTKNAPRGLKCKINQTFFFENTGSQKGGRGGGGARHLETIPKKSRFFFLGASLSNKRLLKEPPFC